MSPPKHRTNWKLQFSAAASLVVALACIPTANAAVSQVESSPHAAPARAAEAVHPLLIGAFMALASALLLIADEQRPGGAAQTTREIPAKRPHMSRRRRVLLFTPEMLRKA